MRVTLQSGVSPLRSGETGKIRDLMSLFLSFEISTGVRVVGGNNESGGNHLQDPAGIHSFRARLAYAWETRTTAT